MPAFQDFEHTLIRGMVLAVVLVGAASITRLGSVKAGHASGAEDEESRSWSRDGRLTLAGHASTVEESSLSSGLLDATAELDLVESGTLAAEGFELSSETTTAADSFTIIDTALVPADLGGYLEFEGDLLLADEATLWIGIGGGVEALAATGEVELGGGLIVEYLEAATVPQPGDYTIITGDPVSGEFASVEWRGWPENVSRHLEVRANEVVVVIE